MSAIARRALTISLAVACLLLTACRRQLMPTPEIHLAAAQNPFEQVPPGLQVSRVDLLYATDRVPTDRDGRFGYGWDRSPSLAFGDCVVSIGEEPSWDDLVRNSRTRTRDMDLTLRVESITELGRFPATPHLTAQDRAEEARASAAFLAELHRRLALVPRKDVFLFVHGFHNSFEIASYTAAEIWHFLPREGVPIVYSWPAGHGGLLQGYEYDGESGLFTIHHLKEFITLLASSPEVQGINILAHSRGTAVVVDALGELFEEDRAAGRDPRTTYRIENLVLAAADIDMMVATQRVLASDLDDGVERTTAYVSQHDEALSISGWLFADRRLGRLSYSDLTEFERSRLAAATRFSVVDVRAHTSGIGHDYFHSAPAASSDLILVLRDNLDPGPEHGRPLTLVGPNYWKLDENYEAPRGSAPSSPQ